MALPFWVAIVVLLLLGVTTLSFFILRRYSTDRAEAFNSRIAGYQAMDRVNPPPEGSILFVGSSVMEFWNTIESDLEPLPVLNRGIAGSKIVQWPYYVEKLIIPYHPSAVVLYAGSNDMHGKKCKTPQKVLEAFISIEEKVHCSLPMVPIYYLSILPSPNKERWCNWEKIKAANQLIAEYTRTKQYLGFIDITGHFLRDGLPIPELFESDMIHLNPKGYEIWARTVKPLFQNN